MSPGLPAELRIIGVQGIPRIPAGCEAGQLISQALVRQEIVLEENDVLIVAQKIVSKAEGRIRILDQIHPSRAARNLAREIGKDPRLVELILQETRRVVRTCPGLLIVETHQGFVCANAGIDDSNNPPNQLTLLPQDPDRSATRIRQLLFENHGQKPAVIISDTFGRPWREGLVNIALGMAGIRPFLDHRGQKDLFGNELKVTRMAVADEMASAAELVMGKGAGIPVVLIRGFPCEETSGRSRDLMRPADQDLFR